MIFDFATRRYNNASPCGSSEIVYYVPYNPKERIYRKWQGGGTERNEPCNLHF